MAEDAFERFRRLRGITQPVIVPGQAQQPETVEAPEERLASAKNGMVPVSLPPCASGACRHADVIMAADTLVCCHCRQPLF
jgi:hypothetical protein